MNYYPLYISNPQFPYQKRELRSPTTCKSSTKQNHSKKIEALPPKNEKKQQTESKNDFFNKTLDSASAILEPIEKLLGRKIQFDDILLVVLIYIIFTEKDTDNNTLLLALVFVLLG